MHRCQPTSRPALPTRQAPARRRQSVRRPRPVGPADHAVQIPPGCRRSAEPDPTPFRKRLRSLVNRRAQDPTGRRRARRRHRRAPLRRGQFYLTTAARPGRSSRRSAPPPGRSSRPGRKQASRPASAAGRPADVPNAACLRARPSRRTLAGAIGAWGCRGLPAAVVPAAAAQLGRPGRARAHQCGRLDDLCCDLASGGAKIRYFIFCQSRIGPAPELGNACPQHAAFPKIRFGAVFRAESGKGTYSEIIQSVFRNNTTAPSYSSTRLSR